MRRPIPLLERTAQHFTAQDIMVPATSLVCAYTDVDAQRELEQHSDFNLIPILDQNDQIYGFVEREREGVQRIELSHLIGGSTGMLEILDVFQTRKYCFVMATAGIDGYIHFSDLNSRFAEFAFYALLQTVEYLLVKQLRTATLTRTDMIAALGANRTDRHFNLLVRLQHNRAELDYFNLFTLNDLLFLARHFGHSNLQDDAIQEMTAVRNAVAHAAEPFIQQHSDVARLVRVRSNCYNILDMDQFHHN